MARWMVTTGTHLPGLLTLSGYAATYLAPFGVNLLESVLFPVLPLPCALNIILACFHPRCPTETELFKIPNHHQMAESPDSIAGLTFVCLTAAFHPFVLSALLWRPGHLFSLLLHCHSSVPRADISSFVLILMLECPRALSLDFSNSTH